MRISIALLLTFFPYGFLYPFEYPAPELIMLSAWVWAFPSATGYLAFLLAPLIVTALYGYYSFNLFCVVANLTLANSACHSNLLNAADFVKIHKVARACMFVTLGIAAMQIVTDQYVWMAVFPHMILEPGRGAGLRLEPSQIASLLCLYLVSVVGRRATIAPGQRVNHQKKALFNEATLTAILTVLETRSITVLIIMFCFLPAFVSISRKRLAITAITVAAGLAIVYSVLGQRINDAAQTSGGSITEFMTTSLMSWRNTPDILILASPADFLLPGKPSEVRLKIQNHAVMLSPLLGWIQNTFTLFSASAISVGLAITGVMLVMGFCIGLKNLKGAVRLKVCWSLLYFAGWFVLAKWDATCWVALGMIPLVHRLGRRERDTATVAAANTFPAVLLDPSLP